MGEAKQPCFHCCPSRLQKQSLTLSSSLRSSLTASTGMIFFCDKLSETKLKNRNKIEEQLFKLVLFLKFNCIYLIAFHFHMFQKWIIYFLITPTAHTCFTLHFLQRWCNTVLCLCLLCMLLQTYFILIITCYKTIVIKYDVK